MIPLAQKIDQLKARYVHEQALPPYATLDLLDALRVRIEVIDARLNAIVKEQIKLIGRLDAVERGVFRSGVSRTGDTDGQ